MHRLGLHIFMHEVALLEDGEVVYRPVEFFGWERLDAVGQIKMPWAVEGPRRVMRRGTPANFRV